MKSCSICSGTYYAKNLCKSHYWMAVRRQRNPQNSYYLSTAERLEKLSMPIPECGCFVWIASLSKKGYGKIAIDGKHYRAHRIAYELHVGPIPEGMLVCHKCDNRACINPAHLFLGTPLENMQDRDRKGRNDQQRGEKQGHAKLKESDILKIRLDNRSQHAIAIDYGVSHTCIGQIKRRESWTHI